MLEKALASYLEGVVRSVGHLPVDVRAAVEAVRELSLRGGKRFRAVLMAAGYEACGGMGGHEAVALAGVSLELLQVYLLIHDDWMDADDIRRGGPSVPAMLRAHFDGREAGRPAGNGSGPVSASGQARATSDAFSVLAGDYAAGLALSALAEVPVAEGRLGAALREMGRIQRDVVLGQMCDVDGPLTREPPTEAAVELTHALKTGSYTVRGPLVLGAHLAGADAKTLAALEAFANPLGVAFQLRDDVLGTFGDPKLTGKPATSDLRQGKRTALIAALVASAKDHETSHLLARAFGSAEASAADVDALLARLVSSGAKQRVEARIESLLGEATTALEAVALTREARALLLSAAHTLAHRET